MVLTLKMKIPTDRKILQAIWDRDYHRFRSFDHQNPDREAKILVPIDLNKIAEDLGVDVDIIFGRLHYHLEPKYGYTRPDGLHVAFFVSATQKELNCVNFVLMAAVLAGLQEESRRHRWALGMSIASLVLSIVAIGITIFRTVVGR